MTEFTGANDPIVRQLLPGYLARRREELETLRDALQRQDFEALRLIGHNLHGSGGAYGLDRVSEFGRALEVAAAAEDSEAIGETIEQMSAFLAEVRP